MSSSHPTTVLCCNCCKFSETKNPSEQRTPHILFGTFVVLTSPLWWENQGHVAVWEVSWGFINRGTLLSCKLMWLELSLHLHVGEAVIWPSLLWPDLPVSFFVKFCRPSTALAALLSHSFKVCSLFVMIARETIPRRDPFKCSSLCLKGFKHYSG